MPCRNGCFGSCRLQLRCLHDALSSQIQTHVSRLHGPLPCRREKFCDFCSSELPDWKSVLTPVPGATAPAVMNVNFDNKTYSFQVAPGADGYRQFTEAIRKAFHLPEDSELNITFTCDEPSSGWSPTSSCIELPSIARFNKNFYVFSCSELEFPCAVCCDSSCGTSSDGASCMLHVVFQAICVMDSYLS